MANSYKNIVITPNIGSSSDDPKIIFSGANTSVNTDITLKVYPTSGGTLSFEGGTGQLFSISNTMTGTIYSVNDISGIPSIEVLDTGLIKLAQYSGNVAIGKATANSKVEIQGDITATSFNGGQLAGMRNRIINGAMMIDQRNAGAAVTVTGGGFYAADRFVFAKSGTVNNFTAQQITGGPDGFSKCLKVTMGTGVTPASNDYVVVNHHIEGLNFADMAFGLTSARTFTLSFWVYSSVAGTYGVGFRNNNSNRSYVAQYTVSSANAWTFISLTVPGDTTGTWAIDNTVGLQVLWDLGVGSFYSTTAGSWQAGNYFGLTGGTKLAATTGATFYITGVQLEKGTVATPFETRMYGTELALCQRYYQTSYPIGVVAQALTNVTDGATFISINTSDSGNGGPLPVTMRTTPTFYSYSSNGGVGANSVRQGPDGANVTGITLVGGTSNNLPRLNKNGGLLSVGNVYTAHWIASAEL